MEQTDVDELYQAILAGDVAVMTGILYERERLHDVADAAAELKTIQNLRTGKRSMESVSPKVRKLRGALDRLDALMRL